MYTSNLALALLPLTTVVTGLQATFWGQSNCLGATLSCNNLFPNGCCHMPDRSAYPAVSWTDIKRHESIWTVAYRGGACTTAVSTYHSGDAARLCLSGGGFTGISYRVAKQPNTKQRRRGSSSSSSSLVITAAGEVVEVEACESSVRADELVLVDGTTYDLEGVEDAVYTEMCRGGSQHEYHRRRA
ncbi:hypothetical protein MN608_11346 [Microdochium nivale]|nr:hypothetical protein MN608_11346 [Microdochium nivale]